MVIKTYCNQCGVQIHDVPESLPIAVNVDGVVYYEGHLCIKHWKELMEILDQYFQTSDETQEES